MKTKYRLLQPEDWGRPIKAFINVGCPHRECGPYAIATIHKVKEQQQEENTYLLSQKNYQK